MVNYPNRVKLFNATLQINNCVIFFNHNGHTLFKTINLISQSLYLSDLRLNKTILMLFMYLFKFYTEIQNDFKTISSSVTKCNTIICYSILYLSKFSQ